MHICQPSGPQAVINTDFWHLKHALTLELYVYTKSEKYTMLGIFSYAFIVMWAHPVLLMDYIFGLYVQVGKQKNLNNYGDD